MSWELEEAVLEFSRVSWLPHLEWQAQKKTVNAENRFAVLQEKSYSDAWQNAGSAMSEGVATAGARFA